MLKNLKNNKKKGFTLVELIVVLVILAILAALLIPALTGYINKAKEKSITAETRQVVMAAQTLVDEKVGTQKAGDVAVVATATDTNKEVSYAEVYSLAEVSGTIDGTVTVTEGKITKLVYKNSGMKCTYEVKSTTTGGTTTYENAGTYTPTKE